jgi:DNA-directed RNA polymerase subunit RPC12/RpoP
MIYKACPRCLGDLFGEDDAGYPEAVCLQCGFRTALARPVRLQPPVAIAAVLPPAGGDHSLVVRPRLPRATSGSAAGSRDYQPDISRRPSRQGSHTLTG